MNNEAPRNEELSQPPTQELSRENARELDMYLGTLENAVRILEEHRDKGESVYVNFNGHKLYSADVTLDGAFQEVLGKTKAEWDEKMRLEHEAYEKEEKESKAEANKKIPEWIEAGKTLADPETLPDWEKMVRSRASDIYHGMDVEAAMEILQKLKDGAPQEEVKAALENQNHSGASYGMVRAIVSHFSAKGKELFDTEETVS